MQTTILSYGPPLMRWLLIIAATFSVNGCAYWVTPGYSPLLPSEAAPVYRSYFRGFTRLPKFHNYDEDTLPKRCMVSFGLYELSTGKTALWYRREIPTPASHQDHELRLDGDQFSVKVINTKTQQVWRLVFLRQANGKFVLVKEEGDFDMKSAR